MLTLKGLLAELNGELLTPGISLDAECTKIFASDLMSDVLAFMERGSVLMTGLVNTHVVRTARLLEVSAIVVVQGKRPNEGVVDEARAHLIPLIATGCSMFETCARLSRSLFGEKS